MILTIVIPTYDRPKSIISSILDLIKLCPRDVEIIILDNASPENIEQLSKDLIIEDLGSIRFLRNIFNIGLVGNICRCYEVASGDWVWTLGDDDKLFPGAIEAVLTSIRNLVNPSNVIELSFSSSIFQYEESFDLSDLKAYWDIMSQPLAFSNALFISTSVMNRKLAGGFLRVAYMQNSSFAPHLAIVLSAIAKGNSVVTSTFKIVSTIVPNDNDSSWNGLTVFGGIPLLAELVDDETTKRSLHMALQYYSPGLSIKNGARMIFLDKGRDFGYYYIYYSRLCPVLRGGALLVSITMRFLSGICFRFPVIGRFCKLVFKGMGLQGKDSTKGITRL